MSLELVGTLKVINEKKQVTEKFANREFVIEIQDGEYLNLVSLQLVNNSCDSLNYHKLGDVVKVYFNVRSNEYNGRYFTNLTAWRVEKAPTGTIVSIPEIAQVDQDLPF